jgi:PKD repeat protein
MIKKIILVLLFLINSILVWSQTKSTSKISTLIKQKKEARLHKKEKIWRSPLQNNTINFYQVQQAFYKMWNKEKEEIAKENTIKTNAYEEDESKESEYFRFKRWEYYMAPRVYPTGDLSLPSTTWQQFESYLKSNAKANQIYQQNILNNNKNNSTGNKNSNGVASLISGSGWVFAGPTGQPTGGGAGRLNFVRFDPTNSNTIYVGAPDGGVWKSTNGGASWTTNTDQLAVIGSSDLAIDYTNTQNMYLATGDGDHGDSRSIGVLKSTDGGATWLASGLTFTVNAGVLIYKLIINPINPNSLYAATTAGLFKTVNGGANWVNVAAGNFKDVEFKPKDTLVVYATTASLFYKSVNGGTVFTSITNGVPTGVNRLAIGVTNADSSYVYLLGSLSSNSGFKGLYRSIDAGTSFTNRSTTPNLLGWSSLGNDATSGGQGWYTLSIAVSPTNKDRVLVGGVNIWQSINGGTNWTLNAHWTGSGAPYVHADIHALEFLPGSGTTYFAGSDGGLFKTINNGVAWTDLSAGLSIAQIYKIGLSGANPNLWITGHQDNGTNLYNNSLYNYTLGGDGMDCFIDITDDNVMYGEQYNGNFNRTLDGGQNWSSIKNGLSGSAAWVTPWYQTPNPNSAANTKVIYGGYTELFKSVNQGSNWTQVGAIGGSGTIVDFKVAPSNDQVIYVVRSNAIFKTINGGTNWSTITNPNSSNSITNIDVKWNDANAILITYSGYSANNKIFKSINGGTSFTNISTGLPNIPCNCVRWYPNTTTDQMYVGCDVGVYYLDNTFSSWQPFFTNMPNVGIADIEIFPFTNVIRAATFGRGVWESPVYNPVLASVYALIGQSESITCKGGSVAFTDKTYGNPTSWQWTFNGGTPATATAQNPGSVTWSNSGIYTITLTASNGLSSSSFSTTVNVTNPSTTPFVEGFEGSTFLPTNWKAVNFNGAWAQANTGKNSLKSAFFDNYNTNANGQRDEMQSPPIDLNSFTYAKLKFDVAHAVYNGTYKDSLQVLISNNCGQTWNSIYLKGYTGLATNGGSSVTAAIFTPSSSQWRTDSIDLSSYTGNGDMMISFKNRGHFGQAIYVDNVNITALNVPVAAITASQTSTCAGTSINFSDNSTNAPTTWSWTFPGGSPSTSSLKNPGAVTWIAAGNPIVQLVASNAAGNNTTSQTINVNANVAPSVAIVANTNNVCSGAPITITATAANSGATPTYQFLVNAIAVQNTLSNIYSTSSFANGDIVTCIVTSNATCASPSAATSNAITINVITGLLWFQDLDVDGFGNVAITTNSCSQPIGYVSNATDCNDNNISINPTAIEICNSIDDNCNGTIDEGCGVVSNTIPANNNPCNSLNASGGSGNVANTTQHTAYDSGSSLFSGCTNFPLANPPYGPNLVYYTGNTSLANNLGINEPIPTCGVSGSNPKSVWYSFKAPSFGAFDVVVRTNYSITNFNCILTAYTINGSPCANNNFIPIVGGCSTNGTLVLSSAILSAYQGQTIYIQLMGNGILNPIGNYLISVQAEATPITVTNINTSSALISLGLVSGLTNLKIYYRKVGNQGFTIFNANPLTTTFTLGSLISGQSYQVWASYSNGIQTFYSTVNTFTTTTGCSGPLAAATAIPVVGHCGSQSFTWPTHPLAVTNYPFRIYNWKTGSSNFYIQAIQNNNTGLTSLSLATNYSFYYKVLCIGGAQQNSSITNYTTCSGAAKQENETVKEPFILYHNGIAFINPTIEELSILVTDQMYNDGKLHNFELNGIQDLVQNTPNNNPIDKSPTFEISPNPNNGNFKITLFEPSTVDGFIYIKIMNANGTKMLQNNKPILKGEREITFNALGLPIGVYLISIANTNIIETKKLIIVE